MKKLKDKLNKTTNDFAWEWLGTQPALKLNPYYYTANTLTDSMESTEVIHYFMNVAHTSDPNVFYKSNVASGYSDDNLAPLKPQNFCGYYSSEEIIFHGK